MTSGGTLRRNWAEALLVLAVAAPWVSLLVLGILWLWQQGHVLIWALAAAALSLLAWPLLRLARRRINTQARLALGSLPEPSPEWTGVEREAWSEVLTLANTTEPFWFTETDPLVASARQIVEAVSRRFHPNNPNAWADFTLPEFLLLTERVSRDLRGKALRTIPGSRDIKLSHALWLSHQWERHGPIAQVLWNWVPGIWRAARAVVNPFAAVGQEVSRLFGDKVFDVALYRIRATLTQEFVLTVGRAAIDLYSGRLALSEEDLRAAREQDASAPTEVTAPVRIALVGQVSAGKSSLVNALAQETRSAIGPLPTTARVAEYRLDLAGRPAVSLVDMPGLEDGDETEFLEQVARADLIVWVVSATQPARDSDRKALEAVRAWESAQLARRAPSIVVALTHIDQLRPAGEWNPPYDIATPAHPKAHAIRAAADSVAKVLGLPVSAIVPVAMPPEREPYNIDALWAAVALALDEAKLVQLDRLRVGRRGLHLRELAGQLGETGRFILRGIAGRNSSR